MYVMRQEQESGEMIESVISSRHDLSEDGQGTCL